MTDSATSTAQAVAPATDAMCRICGSRDVAGRYRFREMMFGLREPFDYFQCGRCGCLQIQEIPADVGRYYGQGYYSLTAPRTRSGLKGWLSRQRSRYVFSGKGWFGRLLHRSWPYVTPAASRWVVRDGISTRSRVLDVGCGSGEMLLDMQAAGFHDLLGVDPFIADEIRYPGGLAILKGTVHDVSGEFDLVMFNHSLEHVPDQRATLQAAARLLAPGGVVMVRVPTVSSEAWETYRENWIQLDAPRHFFLHSVESLQLLGQQAGMQLAAVEYDSNELQFAGSELYRRDIPLTDWRRRYTGKQLRAFRARAQALNHAGRGDQATFYLTPTQR